MSELLTLREAAAFLNVPEATLHYWVHRGTAPKSAKIGRRRMFRRADLDAWIADCFDAADGPAGAA